MQIKHSIIIVSLLLILTHTVNANLAPDVNLDTERSHNTIHTSSALPLTHNKADASNFYELDSRSDLFKNLPNTLSLNIHNRSMSSTQYDVDPHAITLWSLQDHQYRAREYPKKRRSNYNWSPYIEGTPCHHWSVKCHGGLFTHPDYAD